MDKSSDPQMLYAGFDLGTTNSAAAVFDGEEITLARSSQGGALTPSVVRIDSKGRTTVGGRARRFLDRDPDNTCTEFKRLMGTGKEIEFPAAGIKKKPEELAALVLESMRNDVRDQVGVAPVRAVISVPALFELPQNSATSEAARLAGFEQVELLQEPIASALAAGWKSADEGMAGSWMVFDMGGGTFDASLLETRDGLLRVVGHDGDNFLGGRDFDGAIVDWIVDKLVSDGVHLSRANPDHGPVLRALKLVAEEAKIELSRVTETVIALPEPIEVDGLEVDPDLTLDRATLERICTPIFERAISVCRRLLKSHGLTTDQLEQIVLVGGPTVMPMFRQRVGRELGTVVAEGHDPMTLVARGAAIYAATAGLDARPSVASQSLVAVEKSQTTEHGYKLWLQYPPVSSDLTPHVVGRVMDGHGSRPATVKLTRQDGWHSTESRVDGEGGFVIITDLVPRRPNVFTVAATDEAGRSVPVHPERFTIVQGITISDPPLSRSVGVALASDYVHVYFERGAALPARRTFTHHTIESVAKGSQQSVLKIPIVQGEFERAHLCRLIGTLEIPGADIEDSVPSGSPVEVTIELDRGGRLAATALVRPLNQVFEQVAHLLVPNADPDVLESSLESLKTRIMDLRTEAFRRGWTKMLGPLNGAESQLAQVQADVEAVRGGDEDAGQKARRTLLELDAMVGEAELEKQWPELEEDALHTVSDASLWVSRYGTPSEARLMEEITAAIEKARRERNPGELQRQLRLARRLRSTAYYRHPQAWEWMFEGAASEVDSATDLPRAKELVDQGRDALERGDTQTLRRVVESLWRLLPADVQSRRLSFDSGVR